MEPPASYDPGTPALLRAIDATWTLSRLCCPRRFKSGVERFRSVEAMRDAQATSEHEYVRQLRAERDKPSAVR